MNAPVSTTTLAARGPALSDAQASCPRRLGWMTGAPVPPARQIRFADGSAYRFPQLRWSFCHLPELVPTAVVARAAGRPAPLPVALRDDIDGLRFTPLGGAPPMRWDQALAANYTDGIAVLHRGRLVHERCFGALTPDGSHPPQGPAGRHIAMSVTKSVLGLLAMALVADGRLDPQAPVAEQLPELAGTGLAEASVEQLLDMRTALHFSEDYADPHAGIWAHAAAGGLVPRPATYQGPEGYRAFLGTLRASGAHGEGFAYRTVNADALGWLLERASGQPLAELLSRRLWQPLGAEQDAALLVDSQGTAFAGGGLVCGLRDLARLGEMLRLQGQARGRQLLPTAVVQALRCGGDRALMARSGESPQPGWSYRAMWWLTHNRHGAYMARGVHGQLLYINPVAELVIARFASHPAAANAVNDATSLPAWQALADHLLREPG